MRRTLTAAFVSLIAAFALAQTDPHAGHAGHMSPTAAPAVSAAPAVAPMARDETLPPAEETAKAALEKSPRHGEYVDVKVGPGDSVRTWIVYPERKEKAGVVIVISEVFGLSDWLRSVADQLGKEGFIAVAPDPLSGHGPGGGGTDSVSNRDEVVKLIHELQPSEVKARLDAVLAWAIRLPAANGKSATVGFCWGGGQSFLYAAEQPALNAAVVYYGTSPEASELALIAAPVLGLYGGDDARVDETIAPAQAEMKRLGKSYETHVYEGAGHGFLRAQEDRDGANRKAAKQAWPQTIKFLRDRLG